MHVRPTSLFLRRRLATALHHLSSNPVGGLSRHSFVPVLRQTLHGSVAPAHGTGAIAASLAVGCLLIGVAVALLVEARLGLAPYDVFSAGLASTLGLSLGQAGWLVAGMLFVVAAGLGQCPGGWSIAYVLGNGVAVDATVGLLSTPGSLAGRFLFLSTGIVVMAIGINFVVHAGVTGGPFELLMTAGEQRGVSRTVTRYGLDLSILTLGVVIGGPLGIGTIVYASTMALVLGVIRQALLDHRRGRNARLDREVGTSGTGVNRCPRHPSGAAPPAGA